MSLLKNHKTEIWIFFLAFGVRFLYAVSVQVKFGSQGFLAYSDAFSFYLPLAKNLVENHIFSMSAAPPYVPDAYRTPLYPLFLASFLWFKLPIFAIVFAQNVLAGFMAVLVYRIGILIFNSRNVGFFAAVFMSVEPMSVYWNNLLMSDYLFAFLFILAFYYFVLRRYYQFTLFFGLATLTRSVGIYFFPLFLIMMFWRQIGLKKIIVSTTLFLAVLFPWMLRNKIVFDTWQLSSASWYNLYGVVTSIFADREGFILPRPQLPPYDPANIPFYQRHFFEIFKERPWAYAKFYASVVLESLSKNPYFYLTNYVLKPKLPQLFDENFGKWIFAAAAAVWAFWALLYAFALLLFFEKKARIWFYLIFLFFLVNAASVGALGLGADMSRYMLPLTPFILLFAGAGFNFIYKKYAAR